ncbi:MAG: hypothetical protein KF791_07110 [Verrucomicrobiae bacterium]|nr:hypothetical protein [Verrucomicrobiae bacterium]
MDAPVRRVRERGGLLLERLAKDDYGGIVFEAQNQRYGSPPWIQIAILAVLQSVILQAQLPFLGTPLPIPGRIEAEFFDLGGEGVGFHRSGSDQPDDDNDFPYISFRPDEEMTTAIFGPTNVVLKSSEWLSYAVHCTGTGSYTLQVKTSGPPVYLVFIREDRFHPIYDTYPVPATLHLELDGQDVTGPTEVRENLVFPRIRITEGPHQLRLVMDHVADARPRDVGYHGQGFHLWPRNAVAVDWIQLDPAPLALRETRVAGDYHNGFRDGFGEDARFGEGVSLAGQRSSGELVILDPANSAVRLLGTDVRVQTLAGYPGNPVRDGPGTNAGFAKIRDAVITSEDAIVLVDQEENGPDRIRRIAPNGDVSTLHSGRPVVSLQDFSPGQFGFETVERPVPLSRVLLSESGDLLLVGSLDDFWLDIGPGPMHSAEWFPYTRYVWFQLSGNELTLTQLKGPPPPPSEPTDLGNGVRRHPVSGRLVTGNVPGFSTNLVHWSLVVAPISRLTDGTAGGLSSLAVFATEAWISLNLRERPRIEYFRAVLLSR